ncbi:MAG: S8 family serine peptidase [Flavobacteriales bacterium]|nr:S8 family serine peptidase [Flavobacteriales bacterium]
MNFRFALTAALLTFFFYSRAQNNYYFFVQFHDKHLNYKTLSQAHTYLSSKSLDRRKRQHIELDTNDLPVTQAYIDNISSPNVTVQYVSKWLNGAVVRTKYVDSAFLLKIKFFVDEVVYLGKLPIQGASGLSNESEPGSCEGMRGSDFDYGNGARQISMIAGESLHRKGYQGQGMHIAVFDAGFRYVNSLCAFKPLIQEHRLLFTHDVLTGNANVYDDNDHGTNVLGVMAADEPLNMIGTAPKASYLLFRTEIKSSEQLLEELNWVRAAEMADSLGVDIINSSLGYNTFDTGVKDHEQSQLDGKTAYITRAAAMAATRGILVVNSSGNDGNKNWHKINFPADAPGILTVGAVDKDLVPPPFSSYGPTADYRIKPEISALGLQTAITTTYGYGFANGTSFSCPVVAGMMACLWQMNPTLKPAELISMVSRTGHLFDEPDNVIGYGVPDFNLAAEMVNHLKIPSSKAMMIYPVQDTIQSGFVFTAHIPNDSLVRVVLREQKKFLFFRYHKKLDEQPITLSQDGVLRYRIKPVKVKLQQKIDCTILSGKNERLSVQSILIP